jgi:hypothetical protein
VGNFVAASGENQMAIDTRLAARGKLPRRGMKRSNGA